MGLLGVIGVGLRAETKQFDKKIRKSKKGVSGFKLSLKGAAAGLGAMGAAVGAYKMVGVVKQTLSSIDATAKLADRLGTTTEALQGLRHAAELTGVGSENMNKAIEKMNRSIGEAIEGPGAASDALKALGININDLVGLDPAVQFGIIADATNKLGTQSEKASASADIFGRSGLALVNTMALGSAGLKNSAEEAKALGISFGRVDAAKIEMANDAVLRLGQLFKGVGNSITIGLAPYIQSATTYFVEFGKSGGGVSSKILSGVEMLAKGFAYLSIPVRAFQLVWKTTKMVILGVATYSLAGIASMATAIESLANLVPGVNIDISTGLKEIALGLAIQTADAAKDLAKTATKELATSTVKNMFANIRKESTKNAKKIAEQSVAAAATKKGAATAAAAKAGGYVPNVSPYLDPNVDYNPSMNKKTAKKSAAAATAESLAADQSRFLTHKGKSLTSPQMQETKKQTKIQEKMVNAIGESNVLLDAMVKGVMPEFSFLGV